jgi:hypothetical protein
MRHYDLNPKKINIDSKFIDQVINTVGDDFTIRVTTLKNGMVIIENWLVLGKKIYPEKILCIFEDTNYRITEIINEVFGTQPSEQISEEEQRILNDLLKKFQVDFKKN